MSNRSTPDSRKRKQCQATGVPFRMAHRSHVNGTRFIRAWNRRNHEKEMKELKQTWTLLPDPDDPPREDRLEQGRREYMESHFRELWVALG